MPQGCFLIGEASMRPAHNYMKEILKLQKKGHLPKAIGVHEVQVSHDDWCDLLKRGSVHGLCNCHPTIKIKHAWKRDGGGLN